MTVYYLAANQMQPSFKMIPCFTSRFHVRNTIASDTSEFVFRFVVRKYSASSVELWPAWKTSFGKKSFNI